MGGGGGMGGDGMGAGNMGGGGMPGMGGGESGMGVSALNAKLALQMMMGRSPMQAGMQGMPQGVQANGGGWQQDQNGPAMGQSHHKYRTKPCRYFNLPSGCKNGESCNFLHQIVGPDYVFDAPGQNGGGGGRGFGGGKGS